MPAVSPLAPMDFIGPALGAGIFVAIMSLVPHPARRSFNAIFAAGAVGAYIGGGFGVWELIYPVLATPVVYLGLRSYRAIGVAWLMHAAWDLPHQLIGHPIWPYMRTSSLGCMIFDSLIAVWFLVGAPVMLQALLEKIIVYTPEAMAQGSMWWWVLPLAPGVPEILMVGKEREFLNWFYKGPHVGVHDAFSPESIDEYLRTFTGKEGVLGALGLYRAAFETISQTTHLTENKVKIPVVALGGEKGLGVLVGKFVSMVASGVQSKVIPACGHFIPEECPEAVVEQVRLLTVADPVSK